MAKVTKRRAGWVIDIGDTRIIVDRSAHYRRRLHEQGIWVTKDLQEIPVTLMESSHLLNTLRWLERSAKRQVGHRCPTICYPEPSGEMAQEAYWNEVRWEEEHGVDTNFAALDLLLKQPIFPHLVREAKRRRISMLICGHPLADFNNI
jgi:hypothetical protein